MLHCLVLAHPASTCSRKPILWLFWFIWVSKCFFVMRLAQSINLRGGSCGNCRWVCKWTSGLKSCLFPVCLPQKENKYLGLSAVGLLETGFLQMILLSPFVACHLQYPLVPSEPSWIRGSRYRDVCVLIGHVGWWQQNRKLLRLQPLVPTYHQVSQGLRGPRSSVEFG